LQFMRLKKGSPEAREYMAKIRGMRKGGHRKKSRTRRVKTEMARRRWRSYPRRAYRRIRHTKKTLPIAVIGGAVGTLYPAIQQGLSGNFQGALVELVKTAGVDLNSGSFDFGLLVSRLTPIVGGVLAHKLAGWIGVNRALGRSGIPLIRV